MPQVREAKQVRTGSHIVLLPVSPPAEDSSYAGVGAPFQPRSARNSKPRWRAPSMTPSSSRRHVFSPRAGRLGVWFMF